MPPTTENESSLSQSARDDNINAANDVESCSMSLDLQEPIHQPDTVFLPGISTSGTRSNISPIQRIDASTTTGLTNDNSEGETVPVPCDPPPSYSELFKVKPNTVEKGTSMDTTTIVITRTITVPTNRTNIHWHESVAEHRPIAVPPNRTSIHWQESVAEHRPITVSYSSGIFVLFVIILLFAAIYYIAQYIIFILDLY